MPVNPFFNQTTFRPEQDLLQDLMDEAIQIHGHDTYYIKRDDVDVDQLFGEDELAKFTQARPIEMYVKSNQSFAGQSEFISKFGLTIEDQCTFSVSVRRFKKELGTLVTRPREGDIVWLQMTPERRYLFEIRFVEDKEQLFTLGKLYTYELRCELMNYSHERVETGKTEIDSVATAEAYTLEVTVASGAGAYITGETVYQGASFMDANGTGKVQRFDADTNTLFLQNITGVFGNTTQIVGVTSNCVRNAAGAPEAHIPLSDNEMLTDESAGVVVVRGTNPRRA